MENRDVFIVSAVRTAIGVGKPGGGLHHYHPVDLSALVMAEAVKRANISPDHVEDVLWGCVTPVGDQGANMARLSVLKAGFPVTVPAVTMNRMCSSSQGAVHFGAQAVLAGDMDIVLAGGTVHTLVGEPALGFGLVDRPDAKPDVDGDDRIGVILLEENRESVR